MVGSSMEGGGKPYCATIAREKQNLYGHVFSESAEIPLLLPFLLVMSRSALRRLHYAAIAGRRGGVGGKFGRAHAGKTSSGDA